ncbi:hypothetical protein AR457_29090 [Streptomyces agglomeratus]|uniref:Uncharacterized protein n=1 Tax=Streptomyces agglomeratus TaxID=285458 RepID=A0A1E5PEF6_9ACTN|nr:hypothetical protein [Streptomyces agglomeratus]OEJ27928.1 hypothetical protein AS594_28975 [Streptomyces agglomeratus]OEJ38011.1 hypothetical protein BGK70_07565 [Streptomyces agglomeratus]OEJ47606.1 hypothetical protein AR457_29090 [Streptomyces agglomeratus]OEJ50539.1 hypothetical protein BGK72_07035 [Streptomyces agglomeratus]OEJ57901.1 hypothetical protein BGM19_07905 [Streptomyces agglomeratus]
MTGAHHAGHALPRSAQAGRALCARAACGPAPYTREAYGHASRGRAIVSVPHNENTRTEEYQP